MSESEDRFFMGLDLGQSVDFSALVALQRTWLPKEERSGRRRYRYEVRGVRRWPLRTPYTAIASDVTALVSKPPLAGCVLGVDKTGVGAGVLEIIRAARPNATLRPVLITSGHEVARDGAGFRVPKLELVAAVTALLDSGRLAIPATIPEAKTLGKELLSFRAKVTTAGNETMTADWRTRAHDDLVLALAIAAFLGEYGREFWVRIAGDREPGAGEGVRVVQAGVPVPGTKPRPAVEVSAAMGTLFNIPADPRPRGIDLRPDAPGWGRRV
jgi:hypothetical protein